MARFISPSALAGAVSTCINMGTLNYRPDAFTGQGNDNKQVENDIDTVEQTDTRPQAANSPKLRVLLISLDEKGQHDSIFQRLHSKILKKASIDRAKTPSAVVRYLEENTPHSIILTDASLANHDHQTIPVDGISVTNHTLYIDVKEAVFGYLRRGGTVVCACSFAAFLLIKERDYPTIPFFTQVGLPWCAATYSYYRTTFHVNDKAIPDDAKPTLPQRYSPKALNLFQVASEQCWYLPDTETSWVESHTSHSRPNRQWTPVAFAKVELGFLGYIGDVNAEVETDDVVLAMCGLTANIRDWFEDYKESVHDTVRTPMAFLLSDAEDEEHQDRVRTPTEKRVAAEPEGCDSDDEEFWSAAGSVGSMEEYGVVTEKLVTVADEEYDSDVEDLETMFEVEEYICAQSARRTRRIDEDDFWGLD